ncbi:hypothetical protein LZC95_04800 [Pendulispora brunnea]|uniref:Lipoprotein n=1 Tax=Pendulispora brunnea TaxID=2905690 RepID=A0ABZ2KGD8_9BACT
MTKIVRGVLCMAGFIVVAACSKPPATTPAPTEATSGAASASSPPESESARPAPPMPGSDRDAHGCIGSAGYQWCAKENKCVRSWELAKEKGFAVDKGAFDTYCGH